MTLTIDGRQFATDGIEKAEALQQKAYELIKATVESWGVELIYASNAGVHINVNANTGAISIQAVATVVGNLPGFTVPLTTWAAIYSGDK